MSDETARAVPADALAAFIAALFMAAGVSRQAAAIVADGLVEADLAGLASHGVMLTDMYLERLQKGLTIDGRRMRASEVEMLPMKRDASGATLLITLREGRNRQVRNMCDAIGHPVDHLKRVAIGPLRDPRLKVGYWRDLSDEEVKRLQKAAALDRASRDKGHKGDTGHKARAARPKP